MSSPNDQYSDESYREESRYDGDQYTEDEDRGGFPYYPSWGWGGGWGVPLASREKARSDENGSLVDEGLITLFLITGAILFLIPEPATSAVGVLLLFAGAVAWLVDWML
ncbi:hypothetical protein [Halopelagius longus]|uniref:Uncharacterized protein n=1 Tax=Halopelagius longus TaxID=1236180 RepID=A0A1H1FK78_9EURY|nr:hypothetical protein [Halopelagius longus]RDI70069.1 hypothetical protein DWB78_15690 [Halopelagius longus]SDR01139.1 hypothetical protein SAMN05216278_3249 [Halopelagius longus]